MANNDNDTQISSDEYKKVTEAMYKQNLELARLYKQVDQLNKELGEANDRLRELDELKSQFLSFASHQLRSPLTAINGYTSMLLEGDFGEMSGQVKNSVKTIDISSQSLIKIVNEFLDVSRIEQGRMKYEISDFDIKALTEEVVAELRPNVENKGLTFDFSAEPANYIVNTDQGKIKQVIGNIIDNSIKYTPNGGIKVHVENKDSKALISVTDTGIGIDAADIPKLFSMFTRATDAHKTNVNGTGLGLYVAKQMVEAQKGRVWVESPGKGMGSTFFIELPLKS
jgi:signal transduction histidine kinase